MLNLFRTLQRHVVTIQLHQDVVEVYVFLLAAENRAERIHRPTLRSLVFGFFFLVHFVPLLNRVQLVAQEHSRNGF